MLRYRILEGVALADVAYEIYGKTIEELFVNAAEAVSQTMVDTATVTPSQSSKCKVQNAKLEDLLLDFLNNLVLLKDSKQTVFSRFNIKIKKLDAEGYRLNASFWGEKIDPMKHKLRTDVKAVTKHHLEIKKIKNYYRATVVLDI
jgi:SHS2 domain-containing protein